MPQDIEGLQKFVETYPKIFAIALIWIVMWKGWALWQAGGRRDKWWFVAILVINTLGLLEIIYLLFVIPWLDQKEKLAKGPGEEDPQ